MVTFYEFLRKFTAVLILLVIDIISSSLPTK